MLVAFDLSLRLQLHYSCRQLLANVVIAASRVGSQPCVASTTRRACRFRSARRNARRNDATWSRASDSPVSQGGAWSGRVIMGSSASG